LALSIKLFGGVDGANRVVCNATTLLLINWLAASGQLTDSKAELKLFIN
jgi:hypothetical protein